MRAATTALTLLAAGSLARAGVARETQTVQAGPQAVIAAPAGVAELRASIEPLVGRDRTGAWSVLVVSLDHRDTLFAISPGQPLAPASNMKLLTTAAALTYLGPDFRYHTYLLVEGPVEDGVLHGNVYLYGTGDPTLGRRFEQGRAAPLEAFADSLLALGIREVRGDVVGDGSYFQGSSTGNGWPLDDIGHWYVTPAGALSVHENLVRIVVTPGAHPGARPNLEFVPGGRGIAVVNLATTGGAGTIRVRRPSFDAPILVEGSIGGGSSTHALTVADPARYAAAVFREALEARGIVVAGDVRAIDEPARSPVSARSVFAPRFDGPHAPRVVAVHTSPPLREILTIINQQSHNFYAEQVLRTVGRAVTGKGSIEGGAAAIRALLGEAGADTAAIHVADGCGLSPLNRVSAGVFVALLDYMAHSPMAAEFLATLPVAGHTPRFRRMGGTAAAGNLRAKTGTIDHVSALSGYVAARDGERLIFSIISNRVPSTAHAKYVENMIGIRLAEFRRPRGSPAPDASAAPAAARGAATP